MTALPDTLVATSTVLIFCALKTRWIDLGAAFDSLNFRVTGFPVLVQHGSADPVVPVSFGHKARDLLAGLGMDVSFAEYPIGHEISPQSLADLTGWLSARIDETGSR